MSIEELGTKWQIRDDKTGKRVLTDRLEIVIIELPKAKRLYRKDSQDKASQWMMFLNNPNSREVMEIMSKNKDIRKALDELEQVSGDERLQRIAELKEKGRRDYISSMNYAKDERN